MTNTEIQKGRVNVVGYIIIAGAILIAGGLAFLGRNIGDDAAPSFSEGEITASETNFDFGSIPINGGDVVHGFEIRNESAEPVTIEKVYTSCGCTTAIVTDGSGKRYGRFGMPGHGLLSYTDIEILPGQSATVEAIFDPAAHGPSGVGLAQRSVYVETNSAKSPALELSFQAVVTP